MSCASVGICEVNCMLNLGKYISNDVLLCIHIRETTKPILTRESNRICIRESILLIKTDSQH